MTRTREVRLVSTPPTGTAADHLQIVECVLPDPASGQVLVRNRVMALRATMGLLLAGGVPGLPGYQVGETLWGPAVGEVVAGELPPGTLVAHPLGWREYALLDAAQARVLPADADPLLQLSQSEMAHTALTLAPLRKDETVLVSSAAGSIGTMAGRLAGLLGAGRVVGSASAGKVAWLTEHAGFDAAFDRRDTDLIAALRRTAPEGVDVYLDLTGGAQLQAVLEIANPGARIMAIGTLDSPDGATGIDLSTLVAKRITLRGFTPRDHPEAVARAGQEVGDWSRRGLLPVACTVFDGLEQAPSALTGLLEGAHTGTVVVRL